MGFKIPKIKIENGDDPDAGYVHDPLLTLFEKGNYIPDNLDHTQKMALGIVLNWFHSEGAYPLRMLLLRTAGSGETQTIRTIVTTLRSEIERLNLKCRVAICAYTGVASTLMGMGRGGGLNYTFLI